MDESIPTEKHAILHTDETVSKPDVNAGDLLMQVEHGIIKRNLQRIISRVPMWMERI